MQTDDDPRMRTIWPTPQCTYGTTGDILGWASGFRQMHQVSNVLQPGGQALPTRQDLAFLIELLNHRLAGLGLPRL